MTLVTLSKSIDYVFVARKTAYLWNSLIFKTSYQKKKQKKTKKSFGLWYFAFCNVREPRQFSSFAVKRPKHFSDSYKKVNRKKFFF